MLISLCDFLHVFILVGYLIFIIMNTHYERPTISRPRQELGMSMCAYQCLTNAENDCGKDATGTLIDVRHNEFLRLPTVIPDGR